VTRCTALLHAYETGQCRYFAIGVDGDGRPVCGHHHPDRIAKFRSAMAAHRTGIRRLPSRYRMANGGTVSLADIERDLAPRQKTSERGRDQTRTSARSPDTTSRSAEAPIEPSIYYRALCECAQRSMR
jgi:hypothetical protein